MQRYKEIAISLKEKIVEGIFTEGNVLPTQKDLAHQYKTSRVTIRKAIQLLIDEGLLYTRSGSGTYVRNNIRKNNQNVTQINSIFGTTTQEVGKIITSKVLRFGVKLPTEYEMEALSLKSSEPVYDIGRVRYADGKAISIEYSVLPLKIVYGLDEEILQSSIYNYIRDQLKLTISAAQRVIIASKADKLDAEEFGLMIGEPILELNQIVFLDDGTPFDLSKTRYPYTSGRIVADINT